MKDLKELSKYLAKQCLDKEKTYEAAFNELFYQINYEELPEDYEPRIDKKLIE